MYFSVLQFPSNSIYPLCRISFNFFLSFFSLNLQCCKLNIVMEGERRKRKLGSNEEESEEEKLEKFYALIRSTKDVRDRLQANTKDKADKKEDFIEKDKGIWKPTFQPEDFIDDYQQGCFRSTRHSSNPPAPSPSTSAKHDVAQVADKQPTQATAPAPPPPQIEEDDDEKANDHLDLNLSL